MGGSQRLRPAHFFCCCIVRQGFNKNMSSCLKKVFISLHANVCTNKQRLYVTF